MKQVLKALVLGAILANGVLYCAGCSNSLADTGVESTEEDVVQGEDIDSSRSILTGKNNVGHGDIDHCRGGRGRGRNGRGGSESSRW